MQFSLRTILAAISVLCLILALSGLFGGHILGYFLFLTPILIATSWIISLLFPVDRSLPDVQKTEIRLGRITLAIIATPIIALLMMLSNSKLAAWYNYKTASKLAVPISNSDLIEIARYELNSNEWPFLDSYKYQVSRSGGDWWINVTKGNAPGNHATVVVNSSGTVQNTHYGK